MGAVFIKGDVPYPMHSVLDAPVSSPKCEEPAGVGFLRRQAGHGVSHFSPSDVLLADDALYLAYLGQVRPVAVAHQQVGGPQPPLFHPTTVLAYLDCLGWRRRRPIPSRRPIPYGRDVLQPGGLIALHRKEVVPP